MWHASLPSYFLFSWGFIEELGGREIWALSTTDRRRKFRCGRRRSSISPSASSWVSSRGLRPQTLLPSSPLLIPLISIRPQHNQQQLLLLLLFLLWLEVCGWNQHEIELLLLLVHTVAVVLVCNNIE